MGFPYDELIPAAILSDNPGVTAQEFADLLMQTNAYSGEIQYYSFASRDWDHDFKLVWVPDKNQNNSWEDKGHERKRTREEQRNIIRKHNLARWDNSQMFSRRKIGSPKEFDIDKKSRVKELEEASNIHKGLLGLPRIMSLTGKHVVRDVFDLYHDLSIHYSPDWLSSRKILYRIKKNEEEKWFDSLEDLTKQFPDLKPENLIDFSKKNGFFRVGFNDEKNSYFNWYQKSGKYYFDEQHFLDTTHAGGDWLNPGYTDFIITREAVRQGAWKLLTYRGPQHLENAFKRFPKIKEAYEKAVIDSHTSLHAKKQRLTVNELLRLRLEGPMNEEIRRAKSLLL